MEGNNMNK